MPRTPPNAKSPAITKIQTAACAHPSRNAAAIRNAGTVKAGGANCRTAARTPTSLVPAAKSTMCSTRTAR